jgi:hypothetical protein
MSRSPRGIKIETSERVIRGWDAGVYVLPEAEHATFISGAVSPKVAGEAPLPSETADGLRAWVKAEARKKRGYVAIYGDRKSEFERCGVTRAEIEALVHEVKGKTGVGRPRGLRNKPKKMNQK